MPTNDDADRHIEAIRMALLTAKALECPGLQVSTEELATVMAEADRLIALARARNAARKKVTNWMTSEAVAGNLRSNGDAPAWQEYQDALKALNQAIEELGEMPPDHDATAPTPSDQP